MSNNETHKRPGPKSFAYTGHRDLPDGSVAVYYHTTAGPEAVVTAYFDAEDLDLARACYPHWKAKAGAYRIVRHLTRVEKAERVARGRKACSLVRAEELVLERALGRPLAGTPAEVADHINADTLDNRRANLRALSQRLNVALRVDTKRGERLPGASFDTSRDRWQALWRGPGSSKQARLGYFTTELEAFLAYQSRLEREQPGASIAFAAHPLLLERLGRPAATEALTALPSVQQRRDVERLAVRGGRESHRSAV